YLQANVGTDFEVLGLTLDERKDALTKLRETEFWLGRFAHPPRAIGRFVVFELLLVGAHVIVEALLEVAFQFCSCSLTQRHSSELDFQFWNLKLWTAVGPYTLGGRHQFLDRLFDPVCFLNLRMSLK